MTTSTDDTAPLTISSPDGQLQATVIAYGATLCRLRLAGQDMILGYDDPARYAATGNPSYFGATLGRHANRLIGARLPIDGVVHQLDANAGKTHLHGGSHSFSHQVWDLIDHSAESLTFSLLSPAGAMGYPGALACEVCYELTDTACLRLSYRAHTDQATACNLGNHIYFNLGVSDIRDLEARSPASRYQSWPLPGQIHPVDGHDLDLRQTASLRRLCTSEQEPLQNGGSDVFLLVDDQRSDTLRELITLIDPASGRRLSCHSTEVGFTFYTGHYLNGNEIGYDGRAYERYAALCIEPGSLPNGPNLDPVQGILRPDATYRQITEYRFA